VFCDTYHALLDRNHMACSRYYDATTELLMVARQGSAAGFDLAKRNCKVCLEDCKRTAAAMHDHKLAHGC
jgi:hypothetical protein